MDEEQFGHEMRFMTAMILTDKLLAAEIIDSDDYEDIEARMAEKYHPFFR